MAQDFNRMISISFCQKHGIKKEFTTSYTHQQNGVSEKKNNFFVGVVQSKFFHSHLLMTY
jgi:hypothetical protein